jgi:hypothetical protein
MKKGKLGMPRPLGLGLQFNSGTDRPTNIGEIVRENYVDEVKEMMKLQDKEDSEIGNLFYEKDGEWKTKSPNIGEKSYTPRNKDEVTNILERDDNGFVKNRVFSLHTHPPEAVLSHMNYKDIGTCLNMYQEFGPKFLGSGSVVENDDPNNLSLACLTTPTGDFTQEEFRYYNTATSIKTAMVMYTKSVNAVSSGNENRVFKEGISPGEPGSSLLAKMG